ncbi:tyrosine-protein phosphatase non-receptor type substrate 1-like isoform X1 [Notamacropus eugenii]|uniref:tyrosine-protein phosphatase non-receptor type substrate 1-like isoform X1 n=1 Tax=Notamacropus eugenii TaxID=9315 RepID=UPI003B67D418
MFSLSFWASALLTVPLGWSWADTQNVSIEQPSSLVRATIGGSAVLECRSKTDLPAGPVKWFKGTGPNRELIYSDTGSYSRVQKVNNTNRMLDIRISNITSQDEGVYYCIKFNKNPENELGSGGGTRLIVGESSSSSGILIAATAGSVSFILILLVFCCYFKRQKGPSRCLARPEASKKNPSQGEPTRNNEIVYADLQPIGENSQSVSPAERKGLHSEYATIHVQ